MNAKKHAAYYNPWFVEGRELAAVAFYSPDGVQFATRRGWIEHHNKNVQGMTLEGAKVRAARKIDFTKGDIFTATAPEYKNGTNSFVLFVPVQFCTLEIQPEQVSFTTSYVVNYETRIKLTPVNGLKFAEFDFALEHFATRSEDTPLGIEAKELQKVFPKMNQYDLVKILEKYTLTPREVSK